MSDRFFDPSDEDDDYCDHCDCEGTDDCADFCCECGTHIDDCECDDDDEWEFMMPGGGFFPCGKTAIEVTQND